MQFLIVTTVGGILFFAFKGWESSDDEYDVEDDDPTDDEKGDWFVSQVEDDKPQSPET